MSEDKINKLKKEFQAIKTELAIANSKREELFEKLKEYGIKTVAQAEKREGELEKEIDKMKVKMGDLTEKAEKRLEKYRDE